MSAEDSYPHTYEQGVSPSPDRQSGVDVEKRKVVAVDEATRRKVLRKLDWRIIPMVMWIYLMNFMDRVIIGNTRLAGISEDLNLGPDDFQLAVSILFVPYCLFEAPSNLLIKKLKPAYYICGLTICWGIVATFSAFVQSFAGLIACRLLLGTFEAGFFPGVFLYLTLFYDRRSIAFRQSLFFGTSALAGAVGGFVAYGIMNMDGVAGWSAWRWMILLNGIPTILTGIVVPFVLPNSIETAKFLTEDDRKAMFLVHEAEAGRTQSARHLQRKDVMDGVKDWKTYAFGIAQFCFIIMLYSFSVFLPTIINSIGDWDAVTSQALTVPVYVVGAVSYWTVAYLSDLTQQRGLFTIGGAVASIIGFCLLIVNAGSAVSFAGTFFVSAGCWVACGMLLSWLTSNNPRYGKRAYASGIQLTIGNASGVAAPFLFRNIDAPFYRPGYGALIGLLTLGSLLSFMLYVWYRVQNKRRIEGKEDWKLEGKTEEEVAELGDLSPRYRYTL